MVLFSDLKLRTISSLILFFISLSALIMGGIYFDLLINLLIDFPIFNISSMQKIVTICNVQDFNHRKNLEDWEIVTIWPNQVISMINLKPVIVKNLKLPQLGVVL